MITSLLVLAVAYVLAAHMSNATEGAPNPFTLAVAKRVPVSYYAGMGVAALLLTYTTRDSGVNFDFEVAR